MKRIGSRILSKLFFLIWKLRHTLYRFGVFRVHSCCRPVISVGNLSMGGSGKTPWTDFLMTRLKEKGLRPAVVSRGYKASSDKIRLVPVAKSGENDPTVYGDEPSWLARRHPDVAVYIGPRKWRTAEFAARQTPAPDVLIVDDGYQHWRLKRDCNILLIDASEEPGTESMFPAGRAREPFSEVRRADLIVFTKVNLAGPERLEYWRNQVRRAFEAWHLPERPLVEASYELSRFSCHDSSNPGDGKEPGESVVLVSGIAGPKGFEKLVRDQGYNIAHHFVFPDHYHFPIKETKKIEEWCRAHKQSHVIVTEKDAIKLRGWHPTDLSVWVSELTVRIQKGQESIDEIIHKVDALSVQ